MKNKLQQFSVKLLAATLAVIMAVPADVFAMNLKEDKSYAADTSVMGIQSQEDTTNTAESTDSSLIKSSLSTEETTDYIIEKSARLSKTTGDIDYKIVVKSKNPSTEPTGEQTTTFAITENTDDEKLSVDDVKALDADGNETDIKFDQHTPNLLNTKENIRTTGITSAKPQYGMVYYLSTKLTEEALNNLEENSPQLALDITIASPNQNPVQTRYSLELTKPDTTQITIDNDNNVVNQAAELVEKEGNLHLYKGEYKKEEKILFQTTPAHLVWTDYINAKDDREFAIDFDLDENQDTENSQIKIDYYEASDKGFVLNQSFSKTVDFANSLNLTIPQGYIAKVSLSTAIKENTNAKAYTFNGVKVTNPSYKEEKTEKTEEKQASDDSDPLPDASSKNDEEAKSSNDSIADESKQDLSQNPKSDTSAIALNKEAYLENLKNKEKLTENLEKAANDIELALESYNKEETNWDEFKATIQNIAKEQNLDQVQTEEILQALLAGLNEDKYKVANIDTKEATTVVEESTDQSEPKDTAEKSVDQLVKEKLNEEGITIEDFQNYMYELEEKYGLTNEDVARIYGDNAEAIQGLVEKARQEKTTGDVFAVNNQSAFRKTYPYDIDYWSYQYYNPSKNTVNWDIRIETDQVKLEHLNYESMLLSLYAPENQKLTDYKVTVKDYLGNDISNNSNAYKVRQLDNASGSTTFSQENSTLSKEISNELLTYELQIPKSSLPNDLIIHVEAKPTDAARFTYYDLGMRLTPNHNYINDILIQFQNDWNKLLAAMPWIIPYKSGEAAAARFKDGFNVVDTRLPAYTYGINDDKHITQVYADKSRSVFGNYSDISNSKVKWEVSETLRLQDDDRDVLNGDLGSDILNATFTNPDGNNQSAKIEVLEPQSDDGEKLKSIYTITTSDPVEFRTGLAKVKANLTPGTVINYVFERSPVNNKEESAISINFNDRYDDGINGGLVPYGGQRKASIKLYSDENNYHLGGQILPRIPAGTNTKKEWYYINNVPFLSTTAGEMFWVGRQDYESANEPMNAAAWRIIENYDMVFCINPDYPQPNGSDFWKTDPVKINKKPITEHEQLEPYVHKDYKGKTKDLYDKFQKLFFYAEELKETIPLNDRELWGMLQTGILDINGRGGFTFANGVLGDYSTTRKDYKNYEKYLKNKVDNNTLTLEEKESVDLFMYYNSGFNSNNMNGSFQNLLNAKVRKPVKIVKTFEDYTSSNNPSARFKLYDDSGTLITEWIANNNEEKKLYLQPGDYSLEESDVNGNYGKLDKIRFSILEKETVIDGNRIPLSKGYDGDFRETNLGVTSSNRGTLSTHPDKKYMVDNQEYTGNLSKSLYPNAEYTPLPENYNRYYESVFLEKNTKLIENTNNLAGGNYIQTYLELELKDNKNSGLVNIDSNNKLKINATNRKSGRLEVSKKLLAAEGNYHNLPRISFTLSKSGSEEIIATTDKNGIARFDNLPLGSQWTLRENIPTDIVVNHGVTWTVKVDDSGNVTVTPSKQDESISYFKDGVLTVINKPNIKEVFGNFKIIKVNEDNINEKLSGASFILEDESGKNIKEGSTDNQGTISFDNLKPGTYTLKEIKAPNEYQVDPDNDTWTVTVDKQTGDVTIKDKSGKSQSGNTLEYQIKNKKIPSYEFKLKKVSEDNLDIVIEGAEFTLTGPEPSTESMTKRTNANGVISFEDLKPGSYQLVEKEPAPGYYKSDKTWTVTITNDGEAYYRENPSSNVATNTINEIEERTSDRLSLDKNYGTFNLASIINVFRIPEAYAASSGWEKVDSGRSNPVTQSSNEVKTKITEVNKSTNQFKQIFLINVDSKKVSRPGFDIYRQPLNGNLSPQNVISYKVQSVDAGSTIDNIKGTPQDLPILNNKLNGYNGDRSRVTVTTTVNSPILVEIVTTYDSSKAFGLGMDYYYEGIKSANPPKYSGSQYYTSENEINKAVKGEERGYEDTVIPITNSTRYDSNLDEGKVRIVEGNEGIKRTYYIYETENGRRTGVKRVDTSKGTNGVEIIKQMTPTIKYIGTKPLGPEQKTSTFTRDVTINYETETIQDSDLNMGDKKVIQKGQMGTATNKYSITYEKSPGADEPKIKDWPSDIDIEKNRPGRDWRVVEYKVIEESRTSPINEIVKVGTKYVQQSGDISVRDNNGYAVITNKPIEFKIIKSNSSGEKLSGAEFTLYSDKDATQQISIKDVPATVKTDNDGIATFKALPANTYYLKETKAPNGYVPLSKIWTIVVSKDGVTIDGESVEGKYTIIPQTDTDSATIEVINNQPTYPSTGGSGTFIGFALIGTAIMLAGIAYYGIYVNDKNRRRSNR